MSAAVDDLAVDLEDLIAHLNETVSVRDRVLVDGAHEHARLVQVHVARQTQAKRFGGVIATQTEYEQLAVHVRDGVAAAARIRE